MSKFRSWSSMCYNWFVQEKNIVLWSLRGSLWTVSKVVLERFMKVLVLFTTLFLHLSSYNHLQCAPDLPNATLGFRKYWVMLWISLWSITFSRTLLNANNQTPLLLPQTVLSPLFLYMVTIMASLHCCGTSFWFRRLQYTCAGFSCRGSLHVSATHSCPHQGGLIHHVSGATAALSPPQFSL